MSDTVVAVEEKRARGQHFLNWFGVLLLIYLLITAVAMIGAGFKSASAGQAPALFDFVTNPFMGLIVGIVATALIQSSSTVTSIVVGLVAGGVPVSIAVPIVMGANIGTSITNTIVSLAHIRNRDQFRRAFAAATIHDYFNLLAVLIFFPLEIAFGLLEKIGLFIAGLVSGADTASGNLNDSFGIVKAATKPVVNYAQSVLATLPHPWNGVALALVGVLLILLTITFISRSMRVLMVGRVKGMLHNAVGKGPLAGIFSGTVVTVFVQSSSTTTSLMVPLAGAGVLSLRQIYPFTLGANIGTCITALIAALGVVGNAVAALEIALIHLTFNVLGVVVIYGIPPLRVLPLRMAEWFAEVATHNKLYALAYLFGVFFVLPGFCLGISMWL